MSIRKYPGRTEPFVSQKSPRGGRGASMGIGAIVFMVVLFGILLAVLYFVPPLLDDNFFADLGITPLQIMEGFMIFIIVGSIYLIGKGDMFHKGMGSRYKDPDPSMCRRIIREGPDGAEFIITGERDDTFAQACRKDWQFNSIKLHSKWYIRDEKGNDVTDMTLEQSEGIFMLIPELGSETAKDVLDETDEYSSIHDSVEYYD